MSEQESEEKVSPEEKKAYTQHINAQGRRLYETLTGALEPEVAMDVMLTVLANYYRSFDENMTREEYADKVKDTILHNINDMTQHNAN